MTHVTGGEGATIGNIHWSSLFDPRQERGSRASSPVLCLTFPAQPAGLVCKGIIPQALKEGGGGGFVSSFVSSPASLASLLCLQSVWESPLVAQGSAAF